MILKIKVLANAKKNEILEKVLINEDVFYKIKINAPKIDNKANKELIDFLSDIFHIPKSSVKIIKGEKSTLKILDLPIDSNSNEYKKFFV